MSEVLSGGAAPFFNIAICVSLPELPPNPPGEAENGSDCTWVGLSQPTFRPSSKGVELSGLVVVRLSDPCGVGLSQYENVCGANRYSVGWFGLECHSVQLGGGVIVKAPNTLLHGDLLYWYAKTLLHLRALVSCYLSNTLPIVVLSVRYINNIILIVCVLLS